MRRLTENELASKQASPCTRRQFIKTFGAAAVALGSVSSAMHQALEKKEETSLEQQVRNFPKTLQGAGHIEIANMIGAKQCLVFFPFEHSQKDLAAKAGLSVPVSIEASSQRNLKNIAESIADLQTNYPEIGLRTAIWESLSQDRYEARLIVELERRYRNTMRSLTRKMIELPRESEEYDALNKRFSILKTQEGHQLFRQTFGDVGELILDGKLDVRGFETAAINRRTEELYLEIYAKGSTNQAVFMQYGALQKEREQQAIDAAIESGETFVAVMLGTDFHGQLFPQSVAEKNLQCPEHPLAMVIIGHKEQPEPFYGENQLASSDHS